MTINQANDDEIVAAPLRSIKRTIHSRLGWKCLPYPILDNSPLFSNRPVLAMEGNCPVVDAWQVCEDTQKLRVSAAFYRKLS